ncbi:MAG TPA: polysaccharide biosynthesis C-terminal domain-containing protein, partial [Terriglobia bacterium]|nr:polysaccharide biosynthesis C-terminal domain-containing protein [Terriglobia bacterium]
FVVLSAAMIFYGGNNVVSNYLAAEGFPWIAVYVWLIATLVNVALNTILIPSHGIAGAASASLICYAIVFFVQYVYAARIAKAG